MKQSYKKTKHFLGGCFIFNVLGWNTLELYTVAIKIKAAELSIVFCIKSTNVMKQEYTPNLSKHQ